MGLEEDILHHYYEETRKEIDFEMVKSLYLNAGGVYVCIRRNIRAPRSSPIVRVSDAELVAAAADWCRTQCKGKYYNNWLNWLFENTEDATAFKLKFG